MIEKATFAAGCFWGVENVFRQLKGVVDTNVGYTGGMKENPTYEEVCSGTTGHAEAVEVEFDPGVISYRELLEVFWRSHDPTQLNRQGPDRGTQYRSAIFYYNDAQERIAKESFDEQRDSGRSGMEIVTELGSASRFWKAEEYHQQYFEKHGNVGCHVNYGSL